MLIYLCHQKGGDFISDKKMGRPTEAPKTHETRIRMSDEDVKILEKCSEALKITKAEVIRLGIRKVYEELK